MFTIPCLLDIVVEYVFLRRPHRGPADRPVPGAGVQAVAERAEPGPAPGGQPQEPHPQAAGAQDSRPHEMGPGPAGERVGAPEGERGRGCVMGRGCV